MDLWCPWSVGTRLPWVPPCPKAGWGEKFGIKMRPCGGLLDSRGQERDFMGRDLQSVGCSEPTWGCHACLSPHPSPLPSVCPPPHGSHSSPPPFYSPAPPAAAAPRGTRRLGLNPWISMEGAPGLKSLNRPQGSHCAGAGGGERSARGMGGLPGPPASPSTVAVGTGRRPPVSRHPAPGLQRARRLGA